MKPSILSAFLKNKISKLKDETQVEDEEVYEEIEGIVEDESVVYDISSIDLEYLDLLCDYLFINTSNEVLPSIPNRVRKEITSEVDDTVSADPIHSLVELKVRTLKNIINIFEFSYNYDDVVKLLVDKNYEDVIVEKFSTHLRYIYDILNDVQNDRSKHSMEKYVIDRNLSLHKRAILNRAYLEFLNYSLRCEDLLSIEYDHDDSRGSYGSISKVSDFPLIFKTIGLYIGLFSDTCFIKLNKKSKKLVPYFQAATISCLNGVIDFSDGLFNGKSYISHSASTYNFVCALLVILYYAEGWNGYLGDSENPDNFIQAFTMIDKILNIQLAEVKAE